MKHQLRADLLRPEPESTTDEKFRVPALDGIVDGPYDSMTLKSLPYQLDLHLLESSLSLRSGVEAIKSALP
jgi:hypothetical protein